MKGAGPVSKAGSGDLDWGRKSPPLTAEFDGSSLPITQRSRRMSRCVIRQHSYDDEIKNAAEATTESTPALGLPAPMPRRASAYDVFAPRPGGDTLGDPANTLGASRHVRRASFRALPPEDPPPVDNDEEERKMRRRGSHLATDIASLRALPTTPWSAAALEDLEAPRRQQSVDGEAIKIVIHDVDSNSAVTASKRRVLLRRDPADKAHRSKLNFL